MRRIFIAAALLLVVVEAQERPLLDFQADALAAFSDDGRELGKRPGGACSAHPACVEELGEEEASSNYCCPTRRGCYLSCCFESVKDKTPAEENGEEEGTSVPGVEGVNGGSLTDNTTFAPTTAAPSTIAPTAADSDIDTVAATTLLPETYDPLGGIDPAFQNGTCFTNPRCFAEGYLGECCPSSTYGTYLDCCDDIPDFGGIEGEGGDSSTTTATCASNARCAELGLIGSCCPTQTGKNRRLFHWALFSRMCRASRDFVASF